jgi:polysaccharide export outer membrane protein
MSLKKGWNLTFRLLFLLAITTAFSACKTYKNIVYFKDVNDSLYNQAQSIPLTNFTDPVIRPNDILQVSVQTLDPQSSSMTGAQTTSTYNVQGASSMAAGGSTVQGFLVDKNGNIELPLVGTIKVSGMTTTDAKEAIRKKASLYYKDPVVNVRFANFNISVIGEVNRPAQYTVPNEKASILDAIAMAGDLTIYGKRENVMLIREEDGVKKAIRFDLNKSDIFQNPYFYLRQGDVIYVAPNKAKAAANDVATIRNISIITSLASLIVVVISRIQF